MHAAVNSGRPAAAPTGGNRHRRLPQARACAPRIGATLGGTRAPRTACPATASPGETDKAAAAAAAARVAAATALYEQAWSTPGGDALLEDLVSADHAQVDAVWQPARAPAGGRAALRKGMRHMRRIYPDLTFQVVQAAACEASGDVFVEWALTGTWEGRAEAASGLSLLSFDGEGRIARTRVYRQALAAEVELAKRGVGGSKPVEQGVLLE
jgi:hypothetical protein